MKGANEPREITMLNRAMVAGIAENLMDEGQETRAESLLAAVRCCDEFPECAHILDWIANERPSC